MSIWVRSQDKKRLIEVNDFKIEKREALKPIGKVRTKIFLSEFSKKDVLQQTESWLKENNFKIIRGDFQADKFYYCRYKVEYQEQESIYVFDIDCGYNNSYTTLGTYSTEEKALKVLDMIFEAVEQGHNFIMPSDEEKEEE